MQAMTMTRSLRFVTDFGFTAHVRPRGEEAKAIKRVVGFKARRSRRGAGAFVDASVLPPVDSLTTRNQRTPLSFLPFACGLIAFWAGGLFA
jgi:putative transposase